MRALVTRLELAELAPRIRLLKEVSSPTVKAIGPMSVSSFPTWLVMVEIVGAEFTRVALVTELFARLTSATVEMTVARFVIEPEFVAVAVMVKRAFPPFAIEPKEQVSVLPARVKLPWLGVADRK